jgi:hypothetical protein
MTGEDARPTLWSGRPRPRFPAYSGERTPALKTPGTEENRTGQIGSSQVRTQVHQVRDWFSGAAAYFGWMREAKRENTRCGLRPMSDKAASQKTQ